MRHFSVVTWGFSSKKIYLINEVRLDMWLTVVYDGNSMAVQYKPTFKESILKQSRVT